MDYDELTELALRFGREAGIEALVPDFCFRNDPWLVLPGGAEAAIRALRFSLDNGIKVCCIRQWRDTPRFDPPEWVLDILVDKPA